MSTSYIEPRLASHAEALFEVMNDPLLYQYVDESHRPVSVAALRERIERNAGGKSPDGTQDWLGWVIKNESEQIVGFVTATIHQDGDAHLAYGVGSKFWGHGYARTAIEQLLPKISRGFAVKQFCIIAERENIRSLKLAQALGFSEENSEIERKKNDLAESEVLLINHAVL